MVTLARCCAAATATTSSTIPYRRLRRLTTTASQENNAAASAAQEDCAASMQMKIGPPSRSCSLKARSDPEDAVVLKVATVGDCQSGKTCFLSKYVGSDHNMAEEEYVETLGMILKEKSLRTKNARIVFSIWELGGNKQSEDLLPKVCEGAAAVIIMFDLTRRSTLKSVKEWFVKVRQYNKFAIPVLVGTKYDQFIDFPQDIQLAITKQAMFYAETMGASLFFSSSTYNINVHKIFKVIVAKLFDLHCSISKNYNLGEPIVAY